MQNVNYVVDAEKKKLYIEIDLTKTTGAVTKGGNAMVATSDNWARLEGLVGFSFNMVLVKKPQSSISDAKVES